MGKRARRSDRETAQARFGEMQLHIVPACTASSYAGGIRACMRLLTDKDSEGGTFLCLKVPREITPGEMAKVLAALSDVMSKGAFDWRIHAPKVAEVAESEKRLPTLEGRGVPGGDIE